MDLYINGYNINPISEIQYIMILVERNIWGTKHKFKVDFGNGKIETNEITDSDGNVIHFLSEVDAMNYLYKCGWIHKDSFISNNPSTGAHITKILFVRNK